MVRGIERREKEYVDVMVKITDDGIADPKEITFYVRDEEGIKIGKGKTYDIEKVLDSRPASSL